jgi:hemerythrin-like domain-containing protein
MPFHHGQTSVDPIAHFMQEHDHVLQQLSALARATRSLAEDGFTEEAFRRVERAVSFIDEEVHTHNKSEEEALFPVLDRYVEGPTRYMREEHTLLRKEYVRLRKAAAAVRDHREDAAATGNLAEASQSMVHLLVNHIHKENHILFPLVRKFLTKDALREVARLIVHGRVEGQPPRRSTPRRKQRRRR